jgi:hypothetical protein
MMSEYWFDISVKLSRILILDCEFFARSKLAPTQDEKHGRHASLIHLKDY